MNKIKMKKERTEKVRKEDVKNMEWNEAKKTRLSMNQFKWKE